MTLIEWSEWFDVGDMIIAKDFVKTDTPYYQARAFDRDSDWSAHETINPGTTASVLFVSRKQTGTGRKWHKILISFGDGHTKIAWIDGPGSWAKIIE